MEEFEATLEHYGGDPTAVLRFDGDRPELLPYATLVSARNAGDGELQALSGVYEWNDRALMFLVDGDRLSRDPGGLARLRRLLAMRGDAPYLAIVAPGQLIIHQIGLDDIAPDASRIAVTGPAHDTSTLFLI